MKLQELREAEDVEGVKQKIARLEKIVDNASLPERQRIDAFNQLHKMHKFNKRFGKDLTINVDFQYPKYREMNIWGKVKNKDELHTLIKQHEDKINALLEPFGVSLLDSTEQLDTPERGGIRVWLEFPPPKG